jgi:hypothetical protein
MDRPQTWALLVVIGGGLAGVWLIRGGSAPYKPSREAIAAANKLGCQLRRDGLDCAEPVSDPSHPVFQPSFDFPKRRPPRERRPWEQIDFRAEPDRYLRAVMAYVMEGQDPGTWRVQDNLKRRWYHAPWLGPGPLGRESTHGLTRERDSAPGDLADTQTGCRQNWAVGFYNPIGGYTVGRVWRKVGSGGLPDLSALPFEPGAVVAKLIFTQTTEMEAPWLAGAPKIDARIVLDDTPDDRDCPPYPGLGRRRMAELRLVQFDVAIRDPRADPTTGWVFASYVYDGRLPGPSPWRKLRPVGLMWGNDPGLDDKAAAAGQTPTEGRVLYKLGFSRDLGRDGRMNGVIDNPISACTSCHMTAQWPVVAAAHFYDGLVPPDAAAWPVAGCWFRNLRGTQAFGLASPCGDLPPPEKLPQGLTALDYSLQLAAGLENHARFRNPPEPETRGNGQYLPNWIRTDARGLQVFPVTRR